MGYRKRLKRREIPGGIRYLTFSCYKRLPLLGNAAIRTVMANSLHAARAAHRFELFAWVVMPEHVHVLVRASDGIDISQVLRTVKVSVSMRVLARWKKLRAAILDHIVHAGRPRFWQPGGGFDRNVRDDAEFTKEIRYIHHNPVERGLVERPEHWQWSSARSWMGIATPWVHDAPPGDPRAWKDWQGFVAQQPESCPNRATDLAARSVPE